jgi:hypothetical protein
MATEATNLGGQRRGQGGQAAFPGAPAGITASFAQQRAQGGHFGGGLLQHGEQLVRRMQMFEDHDDQRLEKELV